MATLKQREMRAGYLFILPAYLIYLAFLLLPLLAALGLSFAQMDRISWDIAWVGFENFDWIITDPRFWTTFRNTFYFIALAVVGNVGLGLIVALALDRAMPGPILYLLRLAYFSARAGLAGLCIVYLEISLLYRFGCHQLFPTTDWVFECAMVDQLIDGDDFSRDHGRLEEHGILHHYLYGRITGSTAQSD